MFVVIFIFLILILSLFSDKTRASRKKELLLFFHFCFVSLLISTTAEDISQFILISEKTELKSGVDPEAFVV